MHKILIDLEDFMMVKKAYTTVFIFRSTKNQNNLSKNNTKNTIFFLRLLANEHKDTNHKIIII